MFWFRGLGLIRFGAIGVCMAFTRCRGLGSVGLVALLRWGISSGWQGLLGLDFMWLEVRACKASWLSNQGKLAIRISGFQEFGWRPTFRASERCHLSCVPAVWGLDYSRLQQHVLLLILDMVPLHARIKRGCM